MDWCLHSTWMAASHHGGRARGQVWPRRPPGTVGSCASSQQRTHTRWTWLGEARFTGGLHLAAGYGLLALVDAVDRTRGSTTRGRRSIEAFPAQHSLMQIFLVTSSNATNALALVSAETKFRWNARKAVRRIRNHSPNKKIDKYKHKYSKRSCWHVYVNAYVCSVHHVYVVQYTMWWNYKLFFSLKHARFTQTSYISSIRNYLSWTDRFTQVDQPMVKSTNLLTV